MHSPTCPHPPAQRTARHLRCLACRERLPVALAIKQHASGARGRAEAAADWPLIYDRDRRRIGAILYNLRAAYML